MKSRTKILILFAAAIFGLNVFSSNPADPNNSGPASVAKVLKEERQFFLGETLAPRGLPAASAGKSTSFGPGGTATVSQSAPVSSTSASVGGTPTVMTNLSSVMPTAGKSSSSAMMIPITGIAQSNQSGYYCPSMNIAQLTDGTSSGKLTYFQVTGKESHGGVMSAADVNPFAQYPNPKWTGKSMPGGAMQYVKLYGIQLAPMTTKVKQSSYNVGKMQAVNYKPIIGIGSWDNAKGKYNKSHNKEFLSYAFLIKDGIPLSFNNIIEVPKAKGGILNPEIKQNNLQPFAQYQTKKNNLVTLYGSLNTEAPTTNTGKFIAQDSSSSSANTIAA